jgi:hypothetical protein
MDLTKKLWVSGRPTLASSFANSSLDKSFCGLVFGPENRFCFMKNHQKIWIRKNLSFPARSFGAVCAPCHSSEIVLSIASAFADRVTVIGFSGVSHLQT